MTREGWRDKESYPVEVARRVKAGLDAPRVSAPPLTAQRPGKRQALILSAPCSDERSVLASDYGTT